MIWVRTRQSGGVVESRPGFANLLKSMPGQGGFQIQGVTVELIYLHRVVAELVGQTAPLEIRVNWQSATLFEINQNVRKLRFQFANVGSIRVSIQEVGMSRYGFTFQLPVLPTDPVDLKEIVSGRMIVQIGTDDPIEIEVPKTATICDNELFVGNQDQDVTAAFGYLDEAGNFSKNPTRLTFKLVDNIPPVDPGMLGVMLVELPDEEVEEEDKDLEEVTA